jgi:fibronectin type 3 domain-containing protein
VKVGAALRAPTRELRDAGRPAGRVGWYRVTALDRAGRESDPSPVALAEIPDLTPPPAPDSVTTSADTGRLSLRWRPVAAPDLRGYRVYRASTADGTFGLLSPTPSRVAAFRDTIPRRADHAFYYRITAVDSAFNESAPSAVVAVRPPDVTPPSAPRIGQVRSGDGALVVTWLANPEPDVAVYRVRFRIKGEVAWRDGRPLPGTRLRDTIPGLAPGRLHEVTLVATDDAGNPSPPAPVVAGTPVRRRPPAQPDLRRVMFETHERGVVVAWTGAVDAVVELLVLRREAGQALRPVGAVRAGTTRFVDRTVRAGRRYEYVVQARDAFGNQADSRVREVSVP